MTNDMETLIKAANAISTKNDHWLFMAALILLLFGMGIVIRYLVGKFENLSAQGRSDQKEYSTRLETIIAGVNKTSADLVVALDRNTCALEENSEHLKESKKRT